METEESITGKKSMSIISEMMEVSKQNLRKDGLLILVWGVIIVINSFTNFLPEVKLLSKRLMKFFNWSEVALGVVGILFTIYYIYIMRKRVRTYVGITARYTWLGIFVVYNLVVIFTNMKTGQTNFELLHPIQMTLIGLALFITGGLYREKLLLAGGIIYWVAAFFAVGYALKYQWMFECGAGLLGFVLPGAWLYYKSRQHV